MRLEQMILAGLLYDEPFTRKVSPFILPEYFEERMERLMVTEALEFFAKYNKLPTADILKIEVGNRKDISDAELAGANTYITALQGHTLPDLDWALSKTEEFCKERSVYNAILKAIAIIDGKDPDHTRDALPQILTDALAVSFDQSIGHDYLEDADSRFDFYHRVEEKIPFSLSLLNTITNGGLSKKTLNVILAGTGVGKSLFMCDFAADVLMQGLNVLYITLEMAEERIGERIDANLMNLTMGDVNTLDRTMYNSRVAKIAAKTRGKLIIKEYPTSSAHSGHFRALLEECKVKKNFIPDILIVDYINICASSRLRLGTNVNSYTYIKAIAEELRGLGQERNIPVLTATQTTRGGFDNSDVGLTDTSESWGLPQTADLMFALITSEDLEALGQVMVKQLKNRYADLNYFKRFVVGIDKSRMKLYDAEDSAQAGIADAGTKIVVPSAASAIGSPVKEGKLWGDFEGFM